MTTEGPAGKVPAERVVCLGNKKVGIVQGTTYTTWRRPEHFVRKFNGWGLQWEVWRDLRDSGVQDIVIDLGTTLLFSRMADWCKYGQNATLNPRDGEQVFLERSYFMEVRK